MDQSLGSLTSLMTSLTPSDNSCMPSLMPSPTIFLLQSLQIMPYLCIHLTVTGMLCHLGTFSHVDQQVSQPGRTLGAAYEKVY